MVSKRAKASSMKASARLGFVQVMQDRQTQFLWSMSELTSRLVWTSPSSLPFITDFRLVHRVYGLDWVLVFARNGGWDWTCSMKSRDKDGAVRV